MGLGKEAAAKQLPLTLSFKPFSVINTKPLLLALHRPRQANESDLKKKEPGVKGWGRGAVEPQPMVFGVTTSSSEIVRRINNDDDDDREKRGITKVLHETFHTLLNTEGGPSSGPSFPSPRCVVHFGKLVSLHIRYDALA